MIGKIAVSAANFAIDKPYSYHIPADMTLTPGQRVMVPFGRGNRRCEGVVLSVEDADARDLKSVEQVLDEESLLSPTMLRLAAFLRERYFCTFYEAVRVMLPAGLWFKEKNTFSLTDEQSWKEKAPRREYALELLTHLENLGGQCAESALRTVVPEEELQPLLQYLLKKKWITGSKSMLRLTRDKTEKIATLAASAEEAMEFASHRPKSAAMQRSVLELICSLGSVSVKELCYYTGATTATVNRLVELGYLTLSEKPVLRCREIRPAVLDGPLVLNEEQQTAWEGLTKQMQQENPGVALLYGVTGSGKTALYLKLPGGGEKCPAFSAGNWLDTSAFEPAGCPFW